MKLTKIVDGLKSLVAIAQAEADGESPLLELAAGVEVEVECGKSGTVTDMGGKTVSFDAENLTELAGHPVDSEETLVKIGHGPIETDTPLYGNVKSLRYDGARDRLLATIVPTTALVRKNREEGFRRVSMELRTKGPRGPFRFDALAFLAARKPAVKGLAAVDLAEDLYAFADEEQPAPFGEVLLREFDAKARKTAAKSGAALPDGSFPIENGQDLKNAIQAAGRASDPEAAKAHIRKRAKALGLTKLLPESWKGADALDTDETVDLVSDEEQEKIKMPDEKEKTAAELAAAKSENERLRGILAAGAASSASAFIAANEKRIPLPLRAAGLEQGLAALLATEAADPPTALKFSIPDPKDKAKVAEINEAPSVFFMRMLAALPPLLKVTETTEITDPAKALEQPEANLAEFDGQDVDEDSVRVHFAVEKRIADAKTKGQELTYLQALQMVEREKRAAAAK